MDQCASCQNSYHLKTAEDSKKLLVNGKEIYVQQGLSKHFNQTHPCSVFTSSLDNSQCHENLVNCDKLNTFSYIDFKTCVAELCQEHLNGSCETQEVSCCDEFIEGHEKFHEITKNYPIQYSYTKYSCEANECTCANGSPVKSTNCIYNAKEKCESCDIGYHRVNSVCLLNKCECEHGKANIGIRCLNNGMPSCEESSCHIGYHYDETSDTCDSNICSTVWKNAQNPPH